MTATDAKERIVVGVDGSPSSADALRWALRQAELTGAAVETVTAWEVQPVYEWTLAVPDESSEKLAGQAQADVVQQVLDEVRPSVEIERHVAQGPPAQVLLDAAKRADLLVVGTRGHRPLLEALLGSVGQQCVHRAACPVVIVHGDDVPSADDLTESA